MPISISRLRRWFAVGAIAVAMVVAGAYLYARWRVARALRQAPQRIGLEVQQSVEGFSVSKSEEGRTIFTVRAAKAVQFKQGGRAELHDVSITLYGRDASRFDQIYGADFEYDPKSGNVTARGEVQIDLEANPAGLTNPDQAAPRELKNPIHLKTSGLVFNQKTGNAYTKERIEFRIPQASGSAVGVNYLAKGNVLILQSQVNITFTGPDAATVTAARGILSKEPRQVVLERPRMVRGPRQFEAGQATLFLRPDNTVGRVLASGEVRAEAVGDSPMHARASQLEILLTGGERDRLRTATFSGDVQIETAGAQSMQANAGRVVLDFHGKNVLDKVRGEENVRLTQHPVAQTGAAQEVEVTAFAMDFLVKNGRHLERGETWGAAQIAILQPATRQRTLVHAGKFLARFDELSRLASLHGEPDTRIVSSAPGQPDRISTSSTLDVTFRSAGGIDSIVQEGSVAYMDGERKAWADRARYSPGDQMLALTGSPRVVETGMTTTARSLRINRSTGDAFAEGEVKSTYSQLREQPGGALLASAAPIHVTARSMSVHRTGAVALYSGEARLWQGANVIQAPALEFDRQSRSVNAQGTPTQTVSTVLVQTEKSGKPTPVSITAARLTYADNQRRAHFEGGVTVKGIGLTVTGQQMDAFLLPRGQVPGNQLVAGEGRLEKIIAEGQIVIQQANRQATGERLVYTAAEDKFVLTGGPPSIFDAEHGKVTGVSLTLFRRDARVLVEGEAKYPTVTHTRVAR